MTLASGGRLLCRPCLFGSTAFATFRAFTFAGLVQCVSHVSKWEACLRLLKWQLKGGPPLLWSDWWTTRGLWEPGPRPVSSAVLKIRPDLDSLDSTRLIPATLMPQVTWKWRNASTRWSYERTRAFERNAGTAGEISTQVPRSKQSRKEIHNDEAFANIWLGKEPPIFV